MNEYFNQVDDLIYIDAGIEGVYLPDDGRKAEETWTKQEREDHIESGYSGQVVLGLKKEGRIILEPVNGIYPIDPTDAIPPSHNCGSEPYQPQRMIANEFAALQICTMMNELFASGSIISHYINFNARNGNSRAEEAEALGEMES
ncbi:hypothetical protein [Paenibacillus apii]|uniref:hypothetical protein n=1 Tax=Paenibacillus apii TaxID=1850370 RepID=UPI0014399A5C|nr:hypothetical protein [Paenibacillus apii]NJJ41354.1 hypothetical protein [Paenibacillus apii]